MFCVRGFGGGVGVSLFFLGGCSGLSVVFSRASGVFCVSRCSAPVVGVGGGLRGVLGFGVWCARVACFLFVGGGLGVRLRAPEWLASSLSGGGFGVRALPGSRGGGRVAPGFLFVFAVFLLVFAGVFGCCFFRPVLLVSSGSAGAWSFVGLWFPRGWGVVGGVGLGWGCFFSGFCCTGPGLFGFGLGFVWRV